jgi:hypothetical protein
LSFANTLGLIWLVLVMTRRFLAVAWCLAIAVPPSAKTSASAGSARAIRRFILPPLWLR